jgi:hypothetical protein
MDSGGDLESGITPVGEHGDQVFCNHPFDWKSGLFNKLQVNIIGSEKKGEFRPEF